MDIRRNKYKADENPFLYDIMFIRGGDFVKKEIKITGYDIAYYSSIITIIASIVLAVFQFINKTNEWDKVFMFFIFGFIGYYTNKENRKKEKNKDK